MKRIIPTGATTKEHAETKTIVYLYPSTTGTFLALGYSGRRTKPDFHYNFKTEERRETYINDYIERQKAWHDEKVERREVRKRENQKAIKNLKVGDIYHAGWGYEQTQCDFYQVVEVKGSTATLREIHAKTVDGSQGMDCDRRIADIGNFKSEPFKKRLSGGRFKISDCQSAKKVNDPKNESFYCSWYY